MTRTTILLSLSILLTAPALACGMYVPDHGSQLAAMQDLMSIDAGSSEAVGDLRNPFAIEDLYFDELVVAYDAPLVQLCKERGRLVAYHCHGHLRHALRRFAESSISYWFL